MGIAYAEGVAYTNGSCVHDVIPFGLGHDGAGTTASN
jgi:hypothetical protein